MTWQRLRGLVGMLDLRKPHAPARREHEAYAETCKTISTHKCSRLVSNSYCITSLRPRAEFSRDSYCEAISSTISARLVLSPPSVTLGRPSRILTKPCFGQGEISDTPPPPVETEKSRRVGLLRRERNVGLGDPKVGRNGSEVGSLRCRRS
jgi:hypothetical protein